MQKPLNGRFGLIFAPFPATAWFQTGQIPIFYVIFKIVVLILFDGLRPTHVILETSSYVASSE